MTITQGTQLSMSMVITHLRGQPGLCPQPDCKGVGEKIGGVLNLMRWYVFAPQVMSSAHKLYVVMLVSSIFFRTAMVWSPILRI